MTFDRFRHRRRTMRLDDRDYAYGPYFVTVVSRQRECLFGEPSEGTVVPNAYGLIASEEWLRMRELRAYVHLDAFVVMPNHVHGILAIEKRNHDSAQVGARRVSPQHENEEAYVHPHGAESGSLGAVIGAFKSAVSRRVNAVRGTAGWTVWQRNYHERILRNQSELNRCRQYIRDNPLNWVRDPENPLLCDDRTRGRGSNG